MPRKVQALVALAALLLVSCYGLFALGGEKHIAVILKKSGVVADDLPDTPDEWRGRIDYRELDRQLAELTARPEMAGLAVAIVERGKLRFVRTYGVVDRSTGVPVTPDTMFRWASLSKTVTGSLAASLASEGAVDLQSPVTNWQTSLRLPGGAESRLTFAQLLSQRTGLTKNAYDEKLEEGQSPRLVRSMLATAPLQCAPGTCYTYQNIAFDTASEILAQAGKRPFADLVSERFFLPLGMTSASYGMTGLTESKDWARPHNGAQVRPLREAYWLVPAASGVSSNIIDFARWMQATMGERPDVLPASVLRLAQTPLVDTPRLYGGPLRQVHSDARYGLGWRSFTYAGHQLFGHSGAVDGYRTTMILEPATRNGVAVMWNSNWGRPFRIPFAVFDSYNKRVDSNWLDLSDLQQTSAPGPEDVP